ncbi:mitochondrial PGP phosphatase-domain-containing protein [Fimicolochytrium jonesii]|uniref:mitochondrial PGP phosphatase-domain-containing protein n=1 Tax=Fimicolochytrium jonesii TaxID=1396493 RepID=UPI0022FE1AD8|nr:mitochondrial PGP phosphatase-domain-containing protein [Fimicolochytrium jonesii]KAI8824271.1 mitochondrial PGP phosphatase-domain-containing protein [Fimicolochytrium jonesii]
MVQSLNLAALSSTFRLIRNPSLLVPHIIVPDIRSLNFTALHAANVTALVFDKDNTLTAPYVVGIHPPFRGAWRECLGVYGREGVVVVSNSAGTGDDVGGAKAREVEKTLGVNVLRHNTKKPAGGSALPTHLSVPPAQIGVIGDRLLTDVVYGNSAGLLTVLVTKIVTEEGDNPFAAMVRRLEHPLLNFLHARGVKPPPHPAMAHPASAEFVRSVADS